MARALNAKQIRINLTKWWKLVQFDLSHQVESLWKDQNHFSWVLFSIYHAFPQGIVAALVMQYDLYWTNGIKIGVVLLLCLLSSMSQDQICEM